MTWCFRCGALAIAAVAILLLGVLASGAAAETRVAADCTQQLDRIGRALTGDRKVDQAQLRALRACVLGAPSGGAAGTLAPDVAGATTQGAEAAAVAVASFQNPLLCFDFNGDGTISSANPTWHVTSGGYLGIPGIFTIFGYSGSFYLGGFSSFGVTIGPFSIELFSLGGVLSGFQVPSCAA
jgi:hypothetical protein